jgi:CxxC motif-containing protein (DUF1111 family)
MSCSITWGRVWRISSARVRTAPLWGVGQRIFFLHDGRTSDLLDAIRAHKSLGSGNIAPSEANGVVDRFQALTPTQQQDLVNFLRAL